MALLRGAKDLDKRVEALLDDARQQVRVNAATWLADIRAEGGEAALRKRLKKEKSDPVRTALIEALQRLGADLSDIIGPASLVAEAEKAAGKGAPELPAWLAGSGLPAIRFRDGATVPERVLRHWLALAIRLKDPGATGQFGIYLDQLDPADARALSAWVLESWIGFDTQSASLDEANAYALANYAGDWRWHRQQQTPELRDRLVAELRQRKLGELLNSGSDTKGVLALACRAEPVWAANRGALVPQEARPPVAPGDGAARRAGGDRRAGDAAGRDRGLGAAQAEEHPGACRGDRRTLCRGPRLELRRARRPHRAGGRLRRRRACSSCRAARTASSTSRGSTRRSRSISSTPRASR
ncbi:MAG: HEAT repeat domain-containing protein [Sphingomonas sp.]